MTTTSPVTEIERWTPAEFSFTTQKCYDNPYTDVDFGAEFRDDTGRILLRPGFWDGASSWKIRFAAPFGGTRWTYRTFCSNPKDAGLHNQTGNLCVVESRSEHPLRSHGLLRMSPGGRNIVHADSHPFLLVADTPWALPFRGRPETVEIYARDRQAKGFNAALLMSVQSDQDTRGPRDRSLPGGFDVAFEDLPHGHIRQLVPEYFQRLDVLADILIDHGIVPVWNPLFQGYGWKGKRTLGGRVATDEYVRFQRYLIARYGASPALWLPNADSSGRTAAVEAAGKEIEARDAYRQPTGFHYNPFDDGPADWTSDLSHGMHHNRMHQDAPWLDFQWAQTGHKGLHLPEKVAAMAENRPIKAVANGESTYEAIARPDNAVGWWQGHEAWSNLVSGGTMGVVYGAGGLWAWKLSADEAGWEAWADSAASWREALDFEGSRYVGFLNRALQGFEFTDMAKRPDLTDGDNLLAIPGQFYLSYLPEGGAATLHDLPAAMPWRGFDPKTGEFGPTQSTAGGSQCFTAPDNEPWVLIVGNKREG